MRDEERNSEERGYGYATKKEPEASWWDNGKKHIAVAAAMLLGTLLLEGILLHGLSFYRTAIGSFLLTKDILIQATILILFTSVIVAAIAGTTKYKGTISKVMHYGLIGLIYLVSLYSYLTDGLNNDVGYTWVMNKANLDILSLHYLNGMTIVMTFVLAGLFLLTGISIVSMKDKDGKRHLYARSKILGIVRLLATDSDERVGETVDFPIIEEKSGEKKGQEIMRERFEEYPVKQKTKPRLTWWNDFVRIGSKGFALWTVGKVLLGLTIATMIADDIAKRFLMVQNYANVSGLGWLGLFQKYFSIFWMRLMGTIYTPPDFAPANAPVFEFYHLFETGIFWFFLILAVRLVLSIIGEILTIMETEQIYNNYVSAMKILANVFTIGVLVKIYGITGIGQEVFDAGKPYYIWESVIWLVVLIVLTAIFKYLAKYPETEETVQSFVDWLKMDSMNIVKAILAVGLVFILLLTPVLWEFFTVESEMQGQQQAYRWTPAIYPSIEWRQWAYGVQDIERVNISAITFSGKEILGQSRMFNDNTAKLNMKPDIGNYNWMSIDPSSADIVMRQKGNQQREYWVSIPTLVVPPYSNDQDVFRSQHMLLTHSEKVVAIDAATSEKINISETFGMKGTPQVYYGEGGLWKDIDEVYVGIPQFQEVHVANYQGNLSYDDKPDYIYGGFWRALKFYPMWMRDFAQGNYGDVKTLVDRDIHERVSRILLPGMTTESDIYPVWDDDGNMYALVWIFINHDSPSEFGVYPDGNDNQIIRKFGVALVSYKNGSVEGYQFNDGKDDYILSFYRSFYPGWNKKMPSWLTNQMRYPEQFMNQQIGIYNEAFQTDFQKYQHNEFYELTMDQTGGNVIEEVRYIMMPLNGDITWSAERLVEPYRAGTRNLVGMYLAPGGNRTGQMYFVDFGDKNIIGPSTALDSVGSIPELTAYPAFTNKVWSSGNILMYSAGNKQYYVIPYYSESKGTLLPQMVAVIDAQSRAGGAYIIKDTANYQEISMAAIYAFGKIGVTISPAESVMIGRAIISGTVTGKYEYVQTGNTRWFIDIQSNNSLTKELIGRAEALSEPMISKLLHLKIGDSTKIEADTNDTILRFVE